MGACADATEAPTAISPPTSSAGSAARSINRERFAGSAAAIGDESARLVAAMRDPLQRAQLASALGRLSRAMADGDAGAATRALDTARDGLRLLESDADRDALRLTLDAASESLTRAAK